MAGIIVGDALGRADNGRTMATGDQPTKPPRIKDWPRLHDWPCSTECTAGVRHVGVPNGVRRSGCRWPNCTKRCTEGWLSVVQLYQRCTEGCTVGGPTVYGGCTVGGVQRCTEGVRSVVSNGVQQVYSREYGRCCTAGVQQGVRTVYGGCTEVYSVGVRRDSLSVPAPVG